MNKRSPGIKGYMIFFACMLILSGCRIADSNTNVINHGASSQEHSGNGELIGAQTGYVAPVIEASGEEIAADSVDDEKEVARAAIGLTQDQIQARMAEQEGNYAYDMLEESLRPLYIEILTILERHAENIKVSTNDSDVLQKVFFYVNTDHPEIYWLDGYSYMRYSRGNEILYLTFSGKYTYTPEETRLHKISIDQYVSRCFAGISMNATDYEKVKYIYEYIINHTEYDINSPDNQNILSVFLNGRSVCQGYAKAAQYLLLKLNVPCAMVVGKVESGEGHAWNLVQIDGAYYYMDPTWGDASYRLDGRPIPGNAELISYEFLNVTTEQLLKTHVIDSPVPMPQCIATGANYYIMENLYFTGYDEGLLKLAFRNAYEQGKDIVTLKCSDETVFAKMQEELFGDQRVFLFLEEQTDSVVYTADEQMCTINVWL